MKIPQNIADLDARILELQNERDMLYEMWKNTVCPIKLGQEVIVTKGKVKRSGKVISQMQSFGKWEYLLETKLKNGERRTLKVYFYEEIEPAT